MELNNINTTSTIVPNTYFYTPIQLKLPLEIEELCYTDIRFRWLLQDQKDRHSHMTISNFINKHFLSSIESIFYDISNYLVKTEKIDTDHIYIDGTKIEANANKYTWVWKNACLSSRDKLFKKISNVIKQINFDIIHEYISFKVFEVYDIPYLEQILKTYKCHYKIDESTFVHGKVKEKATFKEAMSYY